MIIVYLKSRRIVQKRITIEIIGHTKDKEKQRKKLDNYLEGHLMEKAILYAINERMFSLGLIDEKTRDKIKAEISTRK